MKDFVTPKFEDINKTIKKAFAEIAENKEVLREIDLQLTHKFNKSALQVFEENLHSTFISVK